MAFFTLTEPRMTPLSGALQLPTPATAKRRSRSHSGYTPHSLRLTADECMDPFMLENAGSQQQRPAATSSCRQTAASDESTCASSKASEPSADVSEREPDQFEQDKEEPMLTMWPDTDSDTDEYDWTSSSRRRTPASSPTAGDPAMQLVSVQPTSPAGICSPLVVSNGGHFFPMATHSGGSQAPAASALCGHNGVPMVSRQLMQPFAAPALNKLTASVAAGSLSSNDCFRMAAEALAALEAAEVEEASYCLTQLPEPNSASQTPARTGNRRKTRRASGRTSAKAAARPDGQLREDAARSDSGGEVPQPQEDASELPPEVTTLQIRNLPRKLNQKELVDAIHASGFEGRMDFCYVPRDFSSVENHGHAFANFVSPEAAAEFKVTWHRQKRLGSQHQQAINISVATLQGLDANLKKWDNPRMRRVRNPVYWPFLLGRVVDSPPEQTADAMPEHPLHSTSPKQAADPAPKMAADAAPKPSTTSCCLLGRTSATDALAKQRAARL